jgi:hypothetical protein
VHNKFSSCDSHNKTEIFDDRPDILHFRPAGMKTFKKVGGETWVTEIDV